MKWLLSMVASPNWTYPDSVGTCTHRCTAVVLLVPRPPQEAAQPVDQPNDSRRASQSFHQSPPLLRAEFVVAGKHTPVTAPAQPGGGTHMPRFFVAHPECAAGLDETADETISLPADMTRASSHPCYNMHHNAYFLTKKNANKANPSPGESSIITAIHRP